MKFKVLALFTAAVFCLSACSGRSGGGDSAGGKTENTDNSAAASEDTSDSAASKEGNQDEKDQGDFLRLYLKGTSKSASVKDKYIYVLDQRYQVPALDEASAAKYPELYKALSDYEAQYIKDRETVFEDYLDFYREDPGSFDESYRMNEENTITVSRADSKVLSIIYSHNSYAGGAHGYYGNYGVSFDTETGKTLKLSDVVNDEDEFFRLVDASLKTDYADIYSELTTMDEYRKNMVEYGEEYNWSIDYDGVTIYFNPYEIGYYALGAQIVKIGFNEAPELFKEKYLETPTSYFTPLRTYQEVYLDVMGDGKPKKLVAQQRYNQDIEDYEGVDIKLDNKTLSLEDWSFRSDNYILNNNGSYYLYCFQIVENDYSILKIIDLKTLDAGEDSFGLAVGGEYIPGADTRKEDGDLVVYTYQTRDYPLVNPQMMTMSQVVGLFGSYSAKGYYAVGGENMEPVLIDDTLMCYSNFMLRTKRELNAKLVDESGQESEAAAIAKGTYLFPARTDLKSFVDFQILDADEVNQEGEGDYIYFTPRGEKEYDPEKPTYRVVIGEVEDHYMHTVDGIPEDEAFEGIVYAG